MIAGKLPGWPTAERGAARFREWRSTPGAFGAIAMLAALLALSPLVGLLFAALADTSGLWSHLGRYVLPVALVQTALLLAGVATITIVVGGGSAWLVSTFDFPGRDLTAWLLPLPLAIPTYIVAYVYVEVLDTLGPVQSGLRAIFGWDAVARSWFPEVRSLGGAIFVIGFVLYPYVYLAARAMFQAQGAQLSEPARMLGARPWQLARRITLPLARPAIAVGIALALLETVNDIGASEYLGVQTLTLAIFTTWLSRGSLAGAAQMACLMLLIVALLIGLERYGRRHVDVTAPAKDARFAARTALTGPARWVAPAVCLIPVVLGFLLPAAYLAREVVVRGLLIGFDPDLLRHALTTVTFASTATAVTLVVGFCAVAAVRYLKQPVIAGAVSVAAIGYAIPGTVLALGLLSPLVLVDESINAVLRAFGGTGAGLLLAGSSAAVIVAYVIRFLAIAIGFAQAGFARMSGEIDEVARMLGAGPGKLAYSIHMPLARPAMLGAALLIFVDCLKELPATLLLRPLNTETLSTYIYQFAARGSFEEGSLAALIIVMVGVMPVVLMSRYTDLATMVGRGEN